MAYDQRRTYMPLCPRCMKPMEISPSGTLWCPHCGYKIYKHYGGRLWQQKPEVRKFQLNTNLCFGSTLICW